MIPLACLGQKRLNLRYAALDFEIWACGLEIWGTILDGVEEE